MYWLQSVKSHRVGPREAGANRPLWQVARDATTLVQQHKEISSVVQIIENFKTVSSSIKSFYKKSKLLFPIKSNSNKQIIRLLKNEGAGADCASPGEIDIALDAGCRKEDILYTGNYLSATQLLYGVKSGVTINLDDIKYINLLKRSIKAADIDTLSFRVNPGIGVGSYKGIVTGAGLLLFCNQAKS